MIPAGVDKENREDVEHPRPRIHDRGAKRDENPAKHDRSYDPPEQHSVLIFARDAKVGEDQRNDKDVVERQRRFEEIAGEVLDDRLAV